MREFEPNTYDLHLVGERAVKITEQVALEAEALRQGYVTSRTSRHRFYVTLPGNGKLRFVRSRLASTPNSAIKIAKDKDATRYRLAQHGLPIPAGRAFERHDFAGAMRFASELTFPVVVKPTNGGQGLGVTADIADVKSFRLAFERALAAGFRDDRVLVEKHCSGRDLRILACPDGAIAVVERLPASVTGDGQSTVKELIKLKNRTRQVNPYVRSKLINLLDEPNLLLRQGMTEDSVPAEGQRVLLSSVANISRGGESINITNKTHTTVLELASRAVQAIPDLPYAGVDILVEDPALSVREQSPVIIEVNGTPDILMHAFPVFGEPIDVAGEILTRYACRSATQPDLRKSNMGEFRIEIAGKVTGVGYRQWFLAKADQFGLDASVRNVGKGVVATIEGLAIRVAMLALACISGPKAAAVRTVITRPLHVTGVRTGSSKNRSMTSFSIDDQDLCNYASTLRYEDLPEHVIRRTRFLLLDALGVSILGASHADSEKIAGLATALAATGTATILGKGISCSSNMAGFANACFSQIHDFTDGNSMANRHGGSPHPGRIVIPTALAEAESAQADGKALLTAIVVGYDIAMKVRGLKSKRTGDFCASAAISARLRGYSADKISHSMGLAGYASISGDGRHNRGADTNYLRVGHTARIGIESAIAAGFGHQGPTIADDPRTSDRFFDRGLGRDFEVMNVYVKPYPTCRMTHSAIEALLQLRSEVGFGPNDVRRIEVKQLPKGMYVARSKPRTSMSLKVAQFNLYYCLARAVLDGNVNVTQFQQECMKDPRVVRLVENIEITSEKALARGFPERSRSARVQVFLTDGSTHTRQVDVPRGDPASFLSERELLQKFASNAESVYGPSGAAEIARLILRIDNLANISELTEALKVTRG